ncbi:MAG: carboxy terminal-processing peptidase [Proteobacteria bacterium]|nr:carboxy terminal-processing peptidase [Pseudomonadota bacterium]
MPKKFWDKYVTLSIFVLILTFIGTSTLFGNHGDSQEIKASKKFFLKSQPLDFNEIYKKIEPMKYHGAVCKEIIKKLNQQHYKTIELNDAFSSKMFDRYLEELDSTRSYFYASDIKELEKYRYFLDDIYKTGDLDGAFIIYNRYHKRIIERLITMIQKVESGSSDIDFTIQEELEADRKGTPWIGKKEEMEDLWRKRLKNSVLSLKLGNKSMEEIPEILSKRFRSQLNRIAQTNSEDVFRVFMNVLNQSYDPHTLYFSPSISEDFDIQMSLSLEGIGAVLQTKNEYTTVSRLVPAGPADKSKLLKPGDRIVGVAQGIQGEMVDVVGWRLDEVVQLIRGPKETVVRLEIIPENEKDDHQTKFINITRNTVKLEEQAAKKEIVQKEINGKPYKIGLLDIPTFYIDFKGAKNGDPDYKSTTRDVRRLLKEFSEEHIDGLIVDLRDNGGGALQEANELTGLFIKKGPTVQVREASGQVLEYRDTDEEIQYDGPLVVIVDRMSASASEIFAGAIQDYNRGLIVGSQTFGKGTVQTLRPLKEGQLKLTLAKFYRISGNSTQHKGVIPDIPYPSIYDMEKIGESSYSDALAWDRISPVPYLPYQDNAYMIQELLTGHNERIKKDPDFLYLMAGIDHLNGIKDDAKVSLNEKARKEEIDQSKAWRMGIENKRRLAKGLEPLTELSEDIDKEEDVNPDKLEDTANASKDETDPILNETENILVDYISMIKSQSIAQKTISKR